MLLRARVVWPVSQPAIDDGAVLVENGRISAVGKWADLSRIGGEVEDLGDVALIPGLVNAHCHLDYTGMAGMILPPSNFPDWIKAILQIKAHWSYTEYAASWLKGARQLLESGVTTVADIEAVPELLPESWEATPLRMVSFFEMTGVRRGNAPERILAEALGHVKRAGATKTKRAGLSPHALFSTPPKLRELLLDQIVKESLPVTMHLAESLEEWQMYHDSAGPLYNWLKPQRSMEDCAGSSPVRRANEEMLLRPGFIAVHVNYLAPGDAVLLASRGASVVHCPRSHDYFGHAPFPYDELATSGVNICLGTDSLASVRTNKGRLPTLNLWEEMQMFARKRPQVLPETIVKMATVNGSEALGSTGAADLVAVEYSGSVEALPEFLVRTTPVVRRRWIGGRAISDSNSQ